MQLFTIAVFDVGTYKDGCHKNCAAATVSAYMTGRFI